MKTLVHERLVGRAAAAVLKRLAAIVLAVAVTQAQGKGPEQPPAWATVCEAQIAEAGRLGIPVAFTNSVGIKFVLVPAGTFMMGSRDSAEEVARRCAMPNAQSGWFYDEHPRHQVTLTNAFYMAIHEVTKAAYEAVVPPKIDPKDAAKQAEDRPGESRDADLPVVNVSWDDAAKFCAELSRRTDEAGRTYVLPTEAQWEHACRAGGATPFSFGETVSTEQANYHGDYIYGDGIKGKHRGKPLPVGSLPANAWGLHEMHGNVSEWCADWYGDYDGAPAINPRGPDEKNPSNERVVRGGAWRSYPGACRSACRLRANTGATSDHIGFRISCDLPAGHTHAASPH